MPNGTQGSDSGSVACECVSTRDQSIRHQNSLPHPTTVVRSRTVVRLFFTTKFGQHVSTFITGRLNLPTLSKTSTFYLFYYQPRARFIRGMPQSIRSLSEPNGGVPFVTLESYPSEFNGHAACIVLNHAFTCASHFY